MQSDCFPTTYHLGKGHSDWHGGWGDCFDAIRNRLSGMPKHEVLENPRELGAWFTGIKCGRRWKKEKKQKWAFSKSNQITLASSLHMPEQFPINSLLVGPSLFPSTVNMATGGNCVVEEGVLFLPSMPFNLHRAEALLATPGALWPVLSCRQRQTHLKCFGHSSRRF